MPGPIRHTQNRLWRPTDFGAALAQWFDAADPNTIVLTSGNVSTWKDKGVWANHATQATAGNRPTYSAPTAHATGYVDFTANSGNSYLATPAQTSAMNVLGTKARAMFAVLTSKGTAGYNGYCGYGSLSVSLDSFYLIVNNSHDPVTEFNGASIDSAIAFSANTLEMLTLTSVNGAQILGKNGDTATANRTSSSALSTTSDGFWVGTGSGSLGIGQCYMREVILLAGDFVTEKGYQKVEGYLAWKWGLQGSLPSTHPYVHAAPTVTF